MMMIRFCHALYIFEGLGGHMYENIPFVMNIVMCAEGRSRITLVSVTQ